jgi:hypothetical protein
MPTFKIIPEGPADLQKTLIMIERESMMYSKNDNIVEAMGTDDQLQIFQRSIDIGELKAEIRVHRF